MVVHNKIILTTADTVRILVNVDKNNTLLQKYSVVLDQSQVNLPNSVQ